MSCSVWKASLSIVFYFSGKPLAQYHYFFMNGYTDHLQYNGHYIRSLSFKVGREAADGAWNISLWLWRNDRVCHQRWRWTGRSHVSRPLLCSRHEGLQGVSDQEWKPRLERLTSWWFGESGRTSIPRHYQWRMVTHSVTCWPLYSDVFLISVWQTTRMKERHVSSWDILVGRKDGW